MSSGPQDSANTLYYNNTHYNDTTAPIQSYHKTDLRATFINNASNYQVSINKLKISSLDGVQMGSIPQDTWQIGLEAGQGNTGLGYVSKTGAQGSGEYDEYYCCPQTNSSINLFKSNGIGYPSTVLSFSPVDGVGNPVYPMYSFYDYNENVFWVVAIHAVYLYNQLGAYITSYSPTSSNPNIVNANFNVESGTCVICNSDYIDNVFTVHLLEKLQNAIIHRDITTNHAGTNLTGLLCADTDGTIVIVAYNYNNITTYNYNGLSSIVDRTISTATRITNILVDSLNSQFTFINNEYYPLLMVGANTGSGVNALEFYDVESGALKINNSAHASQNSAVSLFDQYIFMSVDGNFSTGLAATWIAYSSYQALISTTPFNSFVNSGPIFINGAISTSGNDAILMGLVYTANTDIKVYTEGADATWTFEYTIPSTGSLYSNSSADITTQPQIVQDQHTKSMYVVFGNQPTATNTYKILKSTGPITIENTRPCFSYSSTWQIVSTNFDIQSMSIDPNIPNLFWGVGVNNVIYKGHLINGNFLNFEQYTKNTAAGITWGYYISQPIKSSNYNNLQNIVQSDLTSFLQKNTITGTSSNYFSCIQQAIRKNLLYVVDNETIKQYSYNNLAFIKTIQITAPTGIMGQTTSYYIPPNQPTGSSICYSMNDFIVAFNNTFTALYNLLDETGIKAKTAPVLSVDYTTKFGTLSYDPNWSNTNYGVYVNALLYKYLKFPATLITDNTSTFYGMYKYTLNQTGTITQNQYSLYQLNQIDKLLILTNLPILGDFQGVITQSRIFTDLDLDTEDAFFTGSGDVIYQPELLRKYDLVSNSSINRIDYEFKIQYKDGTVLAYYIPPGENVSIKLEFDRVY